MTDKPWLASYDAGVPPSLQPYPRTTLVELLRSGAAERPEHPALLFKGARVTYRELDRQTDALAAALAGLGVKKGDRIALLMPNSPQAVIGQIGAWKAGAVASPINPLYTDHELEHAFRETGAEIAIALTPFYDKVKALQGRTPLRQVIATNVKEYLPSVLRVLFTLLKEKKEGHRITLAPGDLWLPALIAQHAGAPAAGVTVAPEDPALLLFSGGTTGLPKAVLSRHHSLVMAGMQLRAWFAPLLT